MPSIAHRYSIGRATIVLTSIAVLGGCGSTLKASPAAHASAADPASTPGAPPTCAATVLDTLGGVLDRVYREGVSSERTATAEHLIAASTPLREAVEDDNATAARAAAKALLATNHMTNLRVIRGNRTLVNLGGPALAPLKGPLTGATGAPIGSYLASVWSDGGFVDEGDGVAEGRIALRTNGHNVAGSIALAPGALASEGTLMHGHVLYQYTSFPAEAFPSGGVNVYLLRPVRSTANLCGTSGEDTIVNTLSQVASLIYAGESGPRALVQVKRVQHNQALLQAVARREPEATRLAIDKLLNEHIVRLRVSAGGQLLSDVGGPYVLAPVRATLRLDGHTIGSFVLSIQDDEGYLRLAGRLAGLDVLMYMNSAATASSPHLELVKDSLGPTSLGPTAGAVPDSGRYAYRGRTFRVLTLHAEAFPSGPLLIRVLIPIPYPSA
jgi:hypothetical protein